MFECLLVDPSVVGKLVGLNFLLLEPQANLLLGSFDRVGTVADVSADVNGVITTNGAWGRLKRVGGTKDGTTLLNNVLTLPDGSDDRTGSHVLQEAWEERLGLEVSVVFTQELLRRSGHLHGDQLETTLLETVQDWANEASLDSVRLFPFISN
jgi:hypothetical protein